MKKFLIFLSKCLYWCFDSVCFLLETLVELASLVLNFFFILAIDIVLNIVNRLQRLFQVQKWNTPLAKKPFDGFYIRRALRILLSLFAQVVFASCVLQAVPQVGTFFGAIGLFLSGSGVQVIAIIFAFIFLLPQQQVLRDPITRVFFRRGWFDNYGHASFFTKCFSYLIILSLFCAAWSY